MVLVKGLGTIKGFKSDIKIQVGGEPIFCNAHRVPYALHQKVKELDRWENLGAVKNVKRSDCASPIVCVSKKYEVYASVMISRRQ